jgi:hypothetical protein
MSDLKDFRDIMDSFKTHYPFVLIENLTWLHPLKRELQDLLSSSHQDPFWSDLLPELRQLDKALKSAVRVNQEQQIVWIKENMAVWIWLASVCMGIFFIWCSLSSTRKISIDTQRNTHSL